MSKKVLFKDRDEGRGLAVPERGRAALPGPAQPVARDFHKRGMRGRGTRVGKPRVLKRIGRGAYGVCNLVQWERNPPGGVAVGESCVVKASPSPGSATRSGARQKTR